MLKTQFRIFPCLLPRCFDDMKIHQRHGATGKVMWYLTMGIVAVGAVDFLIFIYGALWPPKQQ